MIRRGWDWARPVLVPLVVLLVALGVTVLIVLGIESLPPDHQSGAPVPGDPRRSGDIGMTTYCLPDSELRVFERPFPSGGTQPLFSVVSTADLPPVDPYGC